MADLADIILFLVLAFGISLAGFFAVLKVPNAQTPDSKNGLPIWLIMVWGPTLAGAIIFIKNGTLVENLGKIVQVASMPPIGWLLILSPILLLLLLLPFAKEKREPLPAKLILVSIGFNLMLGPLGEEFGWRGYMQAALQSDVTWLAASLVVGFFWYIWHLPLWFIDSPQSKISPYLFGGHCFCYSVIIGGVFVLSSGSVLSAILLHLTINLAANWAMFKGFSKEDDWFKTSLVAYIILAIITILIVTTQTDLPLFFV